MPKIGIGSTAAYSSEIYAAPVKRAVADTSPPSRKLPDNGWKERMPHKQKKKRERENKYFMRIEQVTDDMRATHSLHMRY